MVEHTDFYAQSDALVLTPHSICRGSLDENITVTMIITNAFESPLVVLQKLTKVHPGYITMYR